MPNGPPPAMSIAMKGPPGQTKPVPEPTKTGRIPFTPKAHSDIKSETYYLQWGDLSKATPLICLHGGPGIPHHYLLPIAHLWKNHGIPVLMYDQIGCGQSTHFREKRMDGEFWTPELFMDELDNLKKHLGIETFDLLGQSWGGMLAAQYASTVPKGLRKLLICDSPASMVQWVKTANRLREQLPKDVQETLKRCEKEGKTDTEEYETAVNVFYERHVCRVLPFPKELTDSLEAVKDDDTVYMTMNGPSEFFVSGTLKTWDITKEVHKISVPTLLVNGKHDEAQDETVEPYFREISKVKWVRFAESSHTPQLEETEDFLIAVSHFIES